MLKIIFVLVLIINCKLTFITSATIKPKDKDKATTELEISLEDDNLKKSLNSNSTEVFQLKMMDIANENPFGANKFEPQAESLILDDLDQKIISIFDIDLFPSSTPKKIEEFSSEETVTGRTLSLSRRTNFETPLNCRCVIRNRCARKNSCLRKGRSTTTTSAQNNAFM